jgi:5-(carboxyamino)imidazole ribonucleotide synthase
MRIGIVGAGQLGQMLGIAARELGHTLSFLDPSADPPAASTGRTIRAAYDDSQALSALAAGADVLSYEFENVPVDALAAIATQIPVYPPPDALRLAQDRLSDKRLFERLDIPVPPYRPVQNHAELAVAVAELGLPCVVKTRRFGYDGKGQIVLRSAGDVARLPKALGDQPLIAEAWVPFDRELSIIAARALDGSTCTWPLTGNRHVDGILRTSIAPVDAPDLAALAETYAQRLLTELDYVGVLALELFTTGNGLLANEFAPRVHNSGPWTIEASTTSQFANHVRAITGAALGVADCPKFAGMVNLIGAIPEAVRRLADPRASLHDYGKSPRPGRKLGHVTVVAARAGERDRLLIELDTFIAQAGELQRVSR